MLDNPTVIYDACVLYPAALRDALVSLALTGLFQARWSDAIHEEWMRNLLDNRADLTRAQLERTRRLMNKAVPDSLVTDYEPLIETLSLPDQDDRHVLAAAIHSGADLIITFNIKHFPPPVLSRYGIEACHPDDFLVQLLEEHPADVVTALRSQRRGLTRPPQSVEAFLETLLQQGLQQAVDLLRGHAASL